MADYYCTYNIEDQFRRHYMYFCSSYRVLRRRLYCRPWPVRSLKPYRPNCTKPYNNPNNGSSFQRHWSESWLRPQLHLRLLEQWKRSLYCLNRFWFQFPTNENLIKFRSNLYQILSQGLCYKYHIK
jgi:hypothetical protein